jgi:hypothetical protein
MLDLADNLINQSFLESSYVFDVLLEDNAMGSKFNEEKI